MTSLEERVQSTESLLSQTQSSLKSAQDTIVTQHKLINSLQNDIKGLNQSLDAQIRENQEIKKVMKKSIKSLEAEAETQKTQDKAILQLQRQVKATKNQEDHGKEDSGLEDRVEALEDKDKQQGADLKELKSKSEKSELDVDELQDEVDEVEKQATRLSYKQEIQRIVQEDRMETISIAWVAILIVWPLLAGLIMIGLYHKYLKSLSHENRMQSSYRTAIQLDTGARANSRGN